MKIFFRPWFSFGRLQMRFVTEEVAEERAVLRVCFILLFIFPPQLHTHLSPAHEVCGCPEQAAHYFTLGPKLGALFLTRHLPCPGIKVLWLILLTFQRTMLRCFRFLEWF
jgi:hypothetical protein